MIKVFDNIRVISQMREKEVPLGFVIPWEETAAKKKQLETAQTWARKHDYSAKTTTEGKDHGIIPNEPVKGFKLAQSVRRYGWSGSGNVVWRMEDPRGWEFEIPSENLAQILLSCGIGENGVILLPCIYGREGARNVLLPEGTEFFKSSIKAQDLEQQKKDARLKVKDVPIGSIVSGPNVTKRIYCGQGLIHSNRAVENGKKYHIFAQYIDFTPEDRRWRSYKGRNYWSFQAFVGFSITEVHEKGTGSLDPEVLIALKESLGVKTVPVPKKPAAPGDFRSWLNSPSDHYNDYCNYYSSSDSYEQKLEKVKGLWANPAMATYTAQDHNNYFQIGNDYYAGGFVTQVDLKS